MQEKQNNITLKNYIDFTQLLQEYRGNHEENRLFALKHESLLKSPHSILLQWFRDNAFRVKEPLYSKTFLEHSFTALTILSFISFFLGLFTGIGLLSYSGATPVNIIYYLLFATFLPFISMIVTLLSMITKEGSFSVLKGFFSWYWVEKLLKFFTIKEKFDWVNSYLSLDLQKWMAIYKLQRFSLLFSLGLMIALLFMVVSQDIAFSWSTTLQITAETFHDFLEVLATPWESFFPSSVPSVELVELSQHYRLGENLNYEMVNQANKLGAWWKYLAMATLFYAIFLRTILWLVSGYFFKKQLEKEFLNLNGTKQLLYEFNTPYVSTKAITQENHLDIVEEENVPVKESVNSQYHSILGWNFSDNEMLLVNDSKKIQSNTIYSIGGNHSFEEDEVSASNAKGRVLLYVKAWEPPTMDFVDFLEILVENRDVFEVELFPLGTVENNYIRSKKELSIWKRKIEGLKLNKVWVIDA